MDVEVEPVMSFCGPIVNVRRVKAGTQVSYGGVYTTQSDTNIAVVQMGFADGFPRPWYENGYVSYKGQNYKIAGRACMDQFMEENRAVFYKAGAIAIVPVVLYLLYRLSKGLSRASRGYRVADVKSWF